MSVWLGAGLGDGNANLGVIYFWGSEEKVVLLSTWMVEHRLRLAFEK